MRTLISRTHTAFRCGRRFATLRQFRELFIITGAFSLIKRPFRSHVMKGLWGGGRAGRCYNNRLNISGRRYRVGVGIYDCWIPRTDLIIRRFLAESIPRFIVFIPFVLNGTARAVSTHSCSSSTVSIEDLIVLFLVIYYLVQNSIKTIKLLLLILSISFSILCQWWCYLSLHIADIEIIAG